MENDNLPVGPTDEGNDKRLTGRSDGAGRQLPAQGRAHALAIDLFDEERREDRDEIDLLAYWRILLKRRWLVLGVLAGVTAISLLLTMLATPIYRATAMLQIEREMQQVVKVEGITQVQGGQDYDFYQTQYELLKSRALAERVADELNLAGSGELQQLAQPSWWGRVKALLRPGTPKAVVKPAGGTSTAQRNQAVGIVRGGLVVEPIEDSALVRLHYDSPVPGFAARVANAIAEGYIASGIERRFGASSYAKKYLEDQLAQTKAKLEQSERQLVEFAQKEGIVTSGKDGQSLEGQNLSDLNSALAAAQDQRIRAQARWGQARSARGAALPADMLSNSIIRTLQQQRAQLQGQYQEKLQVYKPDYPLMLQLKGQMDEVDKQIGSELSNIRASVKAEYDAAAAQEGMLMGKLGGLRSQTLDVDKRSIRYNILKREIDTNRELYDGLLQRYKEVGVAGNLSANNISIVDRAEVPGGPYKPSLSRNMIMGLGLGLLLGVLLAFVLEFLDDTLKTPQDVEQRLRLPVLGIIPKLSKQTPQEAAQDLRSAFSESYRSVRTALQFSTDGGVPRVLLVTSPGPGEGKSTSALTLARNFAQLGKRVLLIDADLRNPSQHKALNLRANAGLSSLLAGAAQLPNVVCDTDEERLKVILAGPLPPNPAELLSGSKLVTLLTLAAQIYDQVIIDGPPVLGIADAPILGNVATGTLLVIQSGQTRIASAQASIKRLHSARAHLIGTLLTQYDAKVAGYGYTYEGYYAYGATPQLTQQR